MRARLLTGVALLALAGLGAWAAAALEVETDITHFLPPSGDPRLDEAMRALTGSELNRLVILTVGAPSVDEAAGAAAALGARLAALDTVAWVRSGPDEALQRAAWELYFPRRFAFVDDDPASIPARLTDEALRAHARALRAQLALPTSPFTRELATADPWLLFPERLASLRASLAGALRVHDGTFVTGDGAHGVVLLASRASPFDGAASRALLAGIDRAIAAVRAERPGVPLVVESSAIHRFAVDAEARTRADVGRVSAVGAVGVLVFLLLLFRSPRLVLLGHVPIAAGVVCGLAAAAALFGRIHGLTLAFGATLVGVALDYVVHVLNHHVLEPPPEGAWGTVRRLGAGLALGCATTVAGILGLAWTSFPAIQEMAVMTAVGVFGALAVTVLLLPPWLPARPASPTPLHRRLEHLAGRLLGALARRPRALWGLPALALALAVGGLLRLQVVDDLRALDAQDPALRAEDERVRARVARVETGRLVVVFGDDVEAALARNDALARALEQARAEGVVGRVRSLHALLWSEGLQRENLSRLAADRELAGRTRAAYAAEGFVGDAFRPFEEALAAPTEPLRLDALVASPLGPLVEPFLLSDGRRGGPVALATFLHDVRDADALAARVAEVEGAVWLDQGAYLARGYAAFRERVVELVLVGLVAVLGLVWARYRSLRLALAAFLPAVAAGAGALGAVSLLGFPLTLFHAVSVLLVLSMGVDYGVFLVETTRGGGGAAATVVSLGIAAASTVLSFGSLALSEHVALRAMGLTAALGVLLAFAFAPAAFLFTRR